MQHDSQKREAAPHQKPKIINQISIAAQILDGSITIDSIDEFERILQLFPDDPALLRAYADLMARKNLAEAAVRNYEKAAYLFIESGMILQAVVSKRLQWKIQPPDRLEEVRNSFAALLKGNYTDTPFSVFFSSLSYPSMAAVLNNMVRVRLSAGRIVIKSGDQENNLFFIVTGTLRETVYEPLIRDNETLFRQSTRNLTENDYFGNVYPLGGKRESQANIETITQTELVKITKANVLRLCKKYPDVERGIAELYKKRYLFNEQELLRLNRKAGRHQLYVHINLLAHSVSDDGPVLLEGYTRDISIGGICVILDPKSSHNKSMLGKLKDSKIQISLPLEALTLNVTGHVVWNREILLKGERTIALGVRFSDMTSKVRGMLLAFAEGLRCDQK